MSTTTFLLVLCAALLHASWNFAAKKASGNICVLYNGLLIASIVIAPFFFLLFSWDQFYNAIGYIVATGIIHALYFLFLCKGYEQGDISIVYPVARGSGIAGTALTACFFLQEQVSLAGFAGIIVVTVGTVLVGMKIDQKKAPLLHIMYALLVGLMITGYSIVDKVAVGLINPVLYIFCMALGTVIFLTPYILIYKRRELSPTWHRGKRYSIIIGVGSMGTYLIILFAFQMAHVSYVVAARELSVAIGAFLGIKLLHEPVSKRKTAGIICIILGMILIKTVRG